MLNQQTLIAKELIDTGRYNEAENILLGLNDKFSIFELAKLRRIQGRNKEAEQLYLKALSVQPEIKYPIESDINIELGRIYGSFLQVDLAKERYEKALDRISIEKNIYKEIGVLYFELRNYSEAANYLEKAYALFPNDVQTNICLAKSYRVICQEAKASVILNRLLSQTEIKNSKYLYNYVLNEYETLMMKEYLESKPTEIRNTIINSCNIGCRYCDIWKEGEWKQKEQRTKEVMDLFPYLRIVSWLGGETFLYNGFEEILKEGSKYSDTLTQIIYTNGLLLNERNLEVISQGNITLIIAIDAGKKETYEYLRRGASWDKLCKNLELIKEVSQKKNKKIQTIFNAVISKSNYRELMDMVEMANKYDFTTLRLAPILGSGDENIYLNRDMQAINYINDMLPFVKAKAKEYRIQLDVLIPTKKEPKYKDVNVKYINNNSDSKMIKTNNKSLYCVWPWRQVVIDSKGPMRVCPTSNEWIGDSKKQSIMEFWNGEGMQFYRKKFGEMYLCGETYRLDAGPNDFGSCCNEAMVIDIK